MKRIRSRRKARRSSLEARLVAYSAMAGAALAMAPGAARAVECQGGVVIGTVCYTDIPDVTLSDNGVVPVDLDGDGGAELEVRFERWMTTSSQGWCAIVHGGAASEVGGRSSATRGPDPSNPAALLAGDTVGVPGVGSCSDGFNSLMCSSVFGNWAGRQSRFVGVKVRFSDSGTTHFGWVRLSVGPISNGWVTLQDFAFDLVPGAPLPASVEALRGPTGPVPASGGGR
jgi:hypothetical protein